MSEENEAQDGGDAPADDAPALGGLTFDDDQADSNESDVSHLEGQENGEEAKDEKVEERLYAGKYKSPDDLEKAYQELNKKFGAGKHKVPEEYDLGIVEKLQTVDGEDEILTQFTGLAKEMNLSQEAFDRLVEWYGEASGAAEATMKVDREKEIAKLGPKGPEQIKDMGNWLRSMASPQNGTLSRDEAEAFWSFAASNADNFRVAQKMRGMIQGMDVPVSSQPVADGAITKDDLSALVADPRYGKDKAYTREVERKVQASFDQAS